MITKETRQEIIFVLAIFELMPGQQPHQLAGIVYFIKKKTQKNTKRKQLIVGISAHTCLSFYKFYIPHRTAVSNKDNNVYSYLQSALFIRPAEATCSEVG